jgi:hypothetical protein
MNSLLHRTDALTLGLLLLIAMIIMVILGRFTSKIRNIEPSEPKGGVNSLFSALFALSGLILAFAFGMSQNRLERVRNVVETEVNEMGTAILRADLYPDSVRERLRADFRNYMEAVIAYYENPTKAERLYKAKEDAAKAADKLWARAAQQSKLPNMLIPSQQMIPSLNRMFDAAQSRQIVLKSIIPDLIVYMLFVCVLACCFIGGFASAAFSYRDRIIIVGFAIVTSMVVYTTLDLSRPMRGMIRDEAGKNAIVELRQMFN